MAPVIALSTSTTRLCSRSISVSELSASDADKIPSRSTVPVVTVALASVQAFMLWMATAEVLSPSHVER
ncbi:MAG TPA: hypothetical protein VMI73_10995 [Trebonia sp.]|nr:hypothetical protein [Trebonia sp.]